MNNYNSLENGKKQDLKNCLIKHAMSLGGKNRFLSLIESIRLANPHPLMSREACFRFNKGIIKWEKVIFKEKFVLLLTLTRGNEKNNNLMPEKGDKNYKTILNLLRTIGPIKFKVKPKNIKDGDGFILHPFDIIDNNNCRINFMFEVLFFLPTKLIKKIFIGPTRTN
ncbi:MAG: hypothetical protein CBD21_02525 [bacterium TMED161]|nr:hypothetical protein [Cellvibrionales bacterium]OUW20956.1 MAG: hypothetical protein CBD21_02525 [bacterium TMED161]|tara:strand:- start:75 stop:575 length:501 start_codon:yes stop_codon:yes gene_type:complete